MTSNEFSYCGGYKYQLKTDVVIQTILRPESQCVIQGFIFLDTDGILRIYRGYAWDGCSNAPDTDSNMLAGLVHDALYQLMQEGVLEWDYKPRADWMLKEIMIKQGSFRWVADLFHSAVREFGYTHKKPKKVQVINII